MVSPRSTTGHHRTAELRLCRWRLRDLLQSSAPQTAARQCPPRLPRRRPAAGVRPDGLRGLAGHSEKCHPALRLLAARRCCAPRRTTESGPPDRFTGLCLPATHGRRSDSPARKLETCQYADPIPYGQRTPGHRQPDSRIRRVHRPLSESDRCPAHSQPAGQHAAVCRQHLR